VYACVWWPEGRAGCVTLAKSPSLPAPHFSIHEMKELGYFRIRGCSEKPLRGWGRRKKWLWSGIPLTLPSPLHPQQLCFYVFLIFQFCLKFRWEKVAQNHRMILSWLQTLNIQFYSLLYYKFLHDLEHAKRAKIALPPPATQNPKRKQTHVPRWGQSPMQVCFAPSSTLSLGPCSNLCSLSPAHLMH
jgi:hypothetical protein